MTETVQDKRMVTYPSPDFPGPPTINLRVPNGWTLADSKEYITSGRKIDLAVIAPGPIEGVTPSVIAIAMRTLPSSSPRDLLEKVVEQEAAAVGAVILQQSYTTDESPSFEVTIGRQLPGQGIQQYQVVSYLHHDRLAHVVNIAGTYAAGSKAGRHLVSDIVGSATVATSETAVYSVGPTGLMQ